PVPQARDSPGGRLAASVGEGVPPVPGQPEHPNTEPPEHVGEIHAVAQRLRALHGEHQAESLTASDRVEILPILHQLNAVFVLAQSSITGRYLLEGFSKGSLRQAVVLGADRADLQPDVARAKELQPSGRERIGLT